MPSSLATPIHFSNVSAQMKAFMDATNDRYMTERWLTPRTVGLMVIGAHVFTSTVDAMRRYVDLIAPGHPPVFVATGHADAVGEAQQSEEVRTSASDHGRTHGGRPAGLITRGSPG